jgi:hypothetical protein
MGAAEIGGAGFGGIVAGATRVERVAAGFGSTGWALWNEEVGRDSGGFIPSSWQR